MIPVLELINESEVNEEDLCEEYVGRMNHIEYKIWEIRSFIQNVLSSKFLEDFKQVLDTMGYYHEETIGEKDVNDDNVINYPEE